MFPGEDQCLQAILEKSEPQQDSEDLAGHPHDDSSEPQPSSRDRPGNPHSTVLKFRYSAVDFSFSQASEAGAWLRANLRSRDWQDLKDTCLLPSHLQSPPLMVPPGNPVLDTHGIPWMSQDGRVTSSHAPGKALRASADETKAFYRSAAIPIRFTPAAPAMATEGYMATLHPSAVYSGKAELTEDEEEPKGESVRHGTKPKPPSTFSGLAPCDFLEWVREVEMWFFIDKHKLHERSTQAASYLSGAAANYWRSKQPAVLEWYMRHRPQHYIHEGQPYIPWTAMKKLLANQFSGFSRLQDLVTELNTLRRKPTQTAHDFNTAFSMLIADIASFGSSQALTEPQHILLYVANSNFGISKQTVNPFTKVLVPWASLEEVFNQGLAECDKLRSKAASLSALQPQKHGKSGGRPGQKGHGKHSKQSGGSSSGKSPAQIAGITAEQQQLLNGLLASFQAASGKRPAPSQHQRGGKRMRFDSAASTAPPQEEAGPSNRPKCTYCNRLGHTHETCFKRQNEEAKAAGRPLPFPPSHFQKGKQ